MKKLFITLCIAMIGIGAQAQQKGDIAVGARLGVNLTTLKITDWKVNDHATQFGFGAFSQFSFTDHWRVGLDLTFHPMHNCVSDVQVSASAHYVFHISDKFKVYPLAGFILQFVHYDDYVDGGSRISQDDDTDFGLQLGGGVEYHLTDKWFLSGEYKFQPGIFGDSHSFMGGIGYIF